MGTKCLTAHAVNNDEKVVFLASHIVGMACSYVPASNCSYVFTEPGSETVRRGDDGCETCVIACKAPIHPQRLCHEAEIVGVLAKSDAMQRSCPSTTKLEEF